MSMSALATTGNLLETNRCAVDTGQSEDDGDSAQPRRYDELPTTVTEDTSGIDYT